MSNRIGCIFCSASNPERKKEGKIRCTAYSEWREPFDNVCKDYIDIAAAARLEKIRRMKEAQT